jgi:hypothetical protein
MKNIKVMIIDNGPIPVYVAPNAFIKESGVTGDYDFDNSLKNCNTSGLNKLSMHIRKRKGYHHRTAYNGYSNYGGDD